MYLRTALLSISIACLVLAVSGQKSESDREMNRPADLKDPDVPIGQFYMSLEIAENRPNRFLRATAHFRHKRLNSVLSKHARRQLKNNLESAIDNP